MQRLIPGGLLCILLLCAAAPAQVQVQGPNLTIANFSVWSTLPGADGQRRMAINFRVVNSGTVAAGASTTQITMGGNSTSFATPALAPKVATYFTQTLETNAPVTIQIETNVQQHLVNAPNLNLQTPGLGVTGVVGNGPSNTMEYTANPAGDYGRWEAIGPSRIGTSPAESGRVSTIAVSPVDANTIYAGGRDEGLWKTTGATATWFPITDALPTLEIDAVAIDPGNPNRVMVVTPAGVFQSLNDGSMWTQLTSQNLRANGSDGGRLLISNTQPTLKNLTARRSDVHLPIGLKPMQAIYVTTSSGLQVSTDGGVTWNAVLASGSPVISLQFGTTDATTLFASSANPPAAYEAQNGGLTPASWHQLQGCPQAPLPSFPPIANMWITESQGKQWISFRGKSTDSPAFGLWRSTSVTCNIGGFVEHGWEQVTLTGCNDYNDQWSYVFAHPSDPTVVFKGGISLCRSSSSGDNMTKIPEAQLHVDQHAVMVAPTSPNIMFFGCDGGIYRSIDKGQTLSFFGEGMYNTEVLKIDVNGAAPQQVIVGGAQDNGAFGWDGASPVWNHIEDGDVPLIAFDRSDHKSVYLMTQSTQQIEYFSGGVGVNQWSRGDLQDCQAYSEFPGQVFESMESTGTTPLLLVTCNGIWSGPPWNQIKTPGAGDAFARLQLAPDNPQIAVAATANGHVYWGAALQPNLLYDVFTASNGGGASAIAMANAGTFYVANNAANGIGSITRFTCLIGCTTESIWPQSQSPTGIVTALGIDPLGTDTVLAAIQGNGIFQGVRSSAGQWTWTAYNNGIPIGANITDVEARSDGSIAAAVYGRGVFLLTSRSTAPPPPPTLSATGHVVAFQMAGDDSQVGKPIPKITIARLDSKPDFVFTSTSSAFPGVAVLALALKNHREVQIVYKVNGQNSGVIVSASYAGP